MSEEGEQTVTVPLRTLEDLYDQRDTHEAARNYYHKMYTRQKEVISKYIATEKILQQQIRDLQKRLCEWDPEATQPYSEDEDADVVPK